MGRKAIREKPFDDAIRVLCTKQFHAKYRKLCDAKGLNKSEHIREHLEKEVDAFENKPV